MPDDLITGTYIPVIHSHARVYAIDGIHPTRVLTVILFSQLIATTGLRCCDRTDVVLFQSFIRKSGFFQCSLKDLSNGYVIPVKSIGSGCDPCCVSMRNLAVASLYIMLCITDQSESYFCLRRIRRCVIWFLDIDGTHRCGQDVVVILIFLYSCKAMGSQ